MAKFRIATPAGASFTVAGGGYGYEMEALTPIDAEIYEIAPGSEDEFVAAARDADAARFGMRSGTPRPSVMWQAAQLSS